MSGVKRILVTGATGKQGGALISALLASQPSPPFALVALTRDAKSSRAQALAQKPNVSVVEGDLDNIDEVFRKSPEPFYGVFSVQAVTKTETEQKQGKAVIDAAIAHKVKHFVYSSVDRGGPEKSDTNPTDIPHFLSKHNIELHLKAATAQASTDMKWTILRPVAFMDNWTNNFNGRVFGSMWQLDGADNKLQFVAVKDIGILAADVFKNPERFYSQAISIATDELSPNEASQIFKRVTGGPLPTTFSPIARTIRWLIRDDMGKMLDWFQTDGYGASPAETLRQYPQMMTFETWLRDSSPWRKV